MKSLHLLVPSAEIEIVSDDLWEAGVSGVEERPTDDESVVLVASFEDHLEQAMTQRFAHWSDGEVHELDGDLWADEWRAWARPAQISESLWVSPTWSQLELGASGSVPTDATVLHLEPGRAWGHGAHPTTVLSAIELCAHVTNGMTVLDVGCGSGVLSLVAAHLGGHVIATDIEAEARSVTHANALLNGLESRIEVVEQTLEQIARTTSGFDVVVANIGLAEFRHVAGDLLACSVPNGTLVLSGVLDAQLPELEVVMAPARLVSVGERDGWIAATFVSADSPESEVPDVPGDSEVSD